MLWGFLLANLIDLDHVYYRLIGKVGWFESACTEFGKNCSFGFYPFHNFYLMPILLVMGGLIFVNRKGLKFQILKAMGWVSIGLFVHLVLDYIHLLIGFGI